MINNFHLYQIQTLRTEHPILHIGTVDIQKAWEHPF